MAELIGIIIVFFAVFGGYLLSGGKLSVILKSLPYEFLMIGGAALGAFIISNGGKDSKTSAKAIKRIVSGEKWSKDDYVSGITLSFNLIKLLQKDPIALEAHVEDPSQSSIFSAFPNVHEAKEVRDFICDATRLALLNISHPTQYEELLEKKIDGHHEHSLHSSHAFRNLADGLPALGIVAAVLGVIKTMASIDQPPEVLGKLIGGALVGTFLGVFLAYGFVGPASQRLRSLIDRDIHFLRVLGIIFSMNANGHPLSVSIEFARQAVPDDVRPSFADIDKATKQNRS